MSESFQITSRIYGSIVKREVFDGAGLFTRAQLYGQCEPVNHSWKNVGFETLWGLP